MCVRFVRAEVKEEEEKKIRIKEQFTTRQNNNQPHTRVLLLASWFSTTSVNPWLFCLLGPLAPFHSGKYATVVRPALLLASGSQDCFIRLWKIALQAPEAASVAEDKFDAMLRTSERIFHVGENTFCSSLDALLAGHENKVFAVSWSQDPLGLRLVSASSDKTLVLWKQDSEVCIACACMHACVSACVRMFSVVM